jgi:cytochrome P450
MTEAATMQQLNIPDHIPPALVVDLDLYDLVREGEDAQTAWQRFRGHGPIVWSPRNGGHWVPTQADDIKALFRDTTNLSATNGTAVPPHGGAQLLPSDMDPPELEEYRRAVMPFFSPGAIDAVVKDIRKLAVDLIEELRPLGQCEFVDDFAHKLPILVFLSIMGLPGEDRLRLIEITNNFARNSDNAAKLQALADVFGYLEERIAERRAKPTGDVISRLLEATFNGRVYTHDEVLKTCVTLLLAGLDTVAALLGFVAGYLAREPEQRAAIRARGNQLAPVSEELLRRFAVANLGRRVARDFELHGVTLKAGDRILLSTVLHNLDAERFAEPMTIDFDRGRIAHLTFGSGAHACLGAYLARTELGIFLEEWLKRIPDFEIAPGAKVESSSGGVDAVDRLPLRWAV